MKHPLFHIETHTIFVFLGSDAGDRKDPQSYTTRVVHQVIDHNGVCRFSNTDRALAEASLEGLQRMAALLRPSAGRAVTRHACRASTRPVVWPGT